MDRSAQCLRAACCTAVLAAVCGASYGEGPAARRVQVAAYYFPNWHINPLVGKNHCEWNDLRAAPPRFPGHYQPKVPLWGYDDESDPKLMARKIAAAADHGIDAFLFDWYYNDYGPHYHTALNEGFLEAPNRKRIKFALMWANHDLQVAVRDGYRWKQIPAWGKIPRKTWDRLVEYVVKHYLTQPNYWRVGGKAYFSIYETNTFIRGLGSVAEAKKALDHFRRRAREAGAGGLHVNAVEFGLKSLPKAGAVVRQLGIDSVTSYVWVHHVKLKDFPQTDYGYVQKKYFAHWALAAKRYGVPYHPNVTMGWDPTPRIPPGEKHTGRGYPDTPIMSGNTPARFRAALAAVKRRLAKAPANERIVTLNAWNEWTEGSYLEPDTVHKMAYLEAVRAVFGRVSASTQPAPEAAGREGRKDPR